MVQYSFGKLERHQQIVIQYQWPPFTREVIEISDGNRALDSLFDESIKKDH